jgi:hypothetical protein
MAQCSCSATDSYAVGQEIQLLSQLTLSSTAYMVHLKLVTGVQDIQQFWFRSSSILSTMHLYLPSNFFPWSSWTKN